LPFTPRKTFFKMGVEWTGGRKNVRFPIMENWPYFGNGER